MNAFLRDERADGELSMMLAVALAGFLVLVLALLFWRFVVVPRFGGGED